ncbi:unnamed protein product [Miscanthus lutarioriparius]|uniref:Uncharacterized protein n=1 Tax=Miscanthus lutarioriparius TaxID=422564 RepID=A0A811Q8Y9_9POAL|nr:unnamed protein product [Miscanthus lutarioriparius]
MAATPEDVAEPEPFSPSVFLDLPPTPHPQPDGDGEDLQASSDDMVLPFIRRMLMEEEEDTDDNILYQQYPDHPALHLAQQPFAQILSAGSTSTATHTHAAANESASGSSATTNSNGAPAFANATWPYDPVELSQLLLCRTRSGTGAGLDGFTGGDANNSFSSPGQGSASACGQARAFFNGGDTATIQSSILGYGVGVTMDMLNQAFLKGMEANKFLPTTTIAIIGVDGDATSKENLPIREGSMLPRVFALPNTNSVVDGRVSGRGCKNRHNWDDLDDDAETDRRSNKLLAPELEENSEQVDDVFVKGYEMAIEKMHGLSISDNNSEQVDDVFVKGEQRRGSQQRRPTRRWTTGPAHLAHPLRGCRVHGQPPQRGRGETPHRGWRTVSPRRSRRGSPARGRRAYKLYLEVCSFKMIAFRFAHIAICKAITGRKKVHIVDYGEHHGFHWPPLLEASKDRDGGPPEVPQRRRVEVGLWEMVCADDLDIEPDEVLIVNGLFHFGKLMDEGVDIDNTSPRDMVLYCYSAMFDIMDATTPRDNEERLLVEQDILGCYVLNASACEGSERVERPETYKQWQVRGHRILKDGYHKDFVVDVGQQWLLQGWKGRILYAMSTWVADDAISHSCSHPFNKHDTCF